MKDKKRQRERALSFHTPWSARPCANRGLRQGDKEERKFEDRKELTKPSNKQNPGTGQRGNDGMLDRNKTLDWQSASAHTRPSFRKVTVNKRGGARGGGVWVSERGHTLIERKREVMKA